MIDYGFKENIGYVIGVDEAGWGAVAGPLYVGGCIVRVDDDLGWLNIKDSKLYTTTRSREIAYSNLERAQQEHKLEFFSWYVDSKHVAENPANALEAAQRVVSSVLLGGGDDPTKNAGIIIDGNRPIDGLAGGAPCRAVPSADRLFKVVSAASVVAKVERDRDLDALHHFYPAYNFNKNKGYPTPQHLKLLFKHGPCLEHRDNISKVREAREFLSE